MPHRPAGLGGFVVKGGENTRLWRLCCGFTKSEANTVGETTLGFETPTHSLVATQALFERRLLVGGQLIVEIAVNKIFEIAVVHGVVPPSVGSFCRR